MLAGIAATFGLWLAEINQQRRRLQTNCLAKLEEGEYTANIDSTQPIWRHSFDSTKFVCFVVTYYSKECKSWQSVPFCSYNALLKWFFWKVNSIHQLVVWSNLKEHRWRELWTGISSVVIELTGSVCKLLWAGSRSSIVVDRVVLWTQRPWRAVLHHHHLTFAIHRIRVLSNYGVEFPLWSASNNWFSVCK